MMIKEEDEQQRLTNRRTDWRDKWCWCDWWDDVTVSFNCKSKLVLLLRLGYLKPFLASSKKTRQGPGWRVGSLCISKCQFYLMVVVIPKQIKNDYKIIWCFVLLCYGSCYDSLIQILMIYKWWSGRCLWNDYEIGRIVEWWIGS